MEITLNRENVNELKEALKKAKEEDKEIFMFKGKKLLVSFAEHLVEFAEQQLPS